MYTAAYLYSGTVEHGLEKIYSSRLTAFYVSVYYPGIVHGENYICRCRCCN